MEVSIIKYNNECQCRSKKTSDGDIPPRAVSSHLCTNFRVRPDLNLSVPKFTDRENAVEASDWLNTVDGLANMNN